MRPEVQAAGRRLYVYYSVDDAKLADALAALRSASGRLCAAHAGLHAMLLLRPEPSAAGERTLMEVWTHRAGVTPALQAQIDAAMAEASVPWRRGDRHAEVFVDPPPAR